MKKVLLKTLISGIIIISILQYNVSVYAANQIDSLQNKQEENEKKINETKEQKSQVSQEKTDVQQQVDNLNEQISGYENEIGNLNSKITNLNGQITEAEEQINQKQEDYNKHQDLFKKRLVATYEAGTTSFLDVILSSKNISDLISNYYLVSEIAEADSSLIKNIESEKKDIEEAKNKLEETKKDLTASKAQKESTSIQLQTAKTEKSKYVSQLSKEEQNLQQEIDDLTKDNQQILSDIQDAQARYAKQLEELKKQAELAKKQQEQQSNSSNSGKNNNKNNTNSNHNSNSGSNSGSNSNSGSGGHTSNPNGFIRPVNGGTITANGYYPSSGAFHGAIDYGVSLGTPVYAAATGVVLTVKNLTTSYGTHVVIQHANGLQTWYAHGTPGSVCVSPGQIVSQGQMIMKSGSSGHSGGPHLHFEVRKAPYTYSYSARKYGDDCRVNPNQYF